MDTSKHKTGWDPKWTKYKWLVPVQDEHGNITGLLCSICRHHNQAQWNGQMYWTKDPFACLRIDNITKHAPLFQHKQAVWKETARLVSERNGGIAQVFQCEVRIQHFYDYNQFDPIIIGCAKGAVLSSCAVPCPCLY